MDFIDENDALNAIISMFMSLFLSQSCDNIDFSLKITPKESYLTFVCDSLDDNFRFFLMRLIKCEQLSEREVVKYEKYLVLRELIDDILMETTDENTTIKLLRKY